MKHHWLGVLVILLGILTTSIIIGGRLKSKPVCKDFKTQMSAQSAFDSDPLKYRSLDRDRDSFVCESLK